MKRVLTIPDLHVPENICLETLYKFISDWQPTHVQWLGDSLDLEVISHWSHQEIMKKYGLDAVRKRLANDAQLFRNIVKRVKGLCKNLVENIFYVGNHEAWIPTYEALYGNAGDEITIASLIRPSETGITRIIPQGHYYKIGKLTYLHGDRYTGGNLEGVLKKILTDFNTNVVSGHRHGVSEVSKNSPIYQHDKKFSKCIGTMGTTNPEFAKERPNQHQNAFHVAYIQDSGMFNDYTVRVFGGRFVAPSGKLYQ